MPLMMPTRHADGDAGGDAEAGVDETARPGGDDRLGGDDLAEDRHRADGEVDAGGDQHERRPARHHGEHGDVLRREDQVVGGEEAVAGGDREEQRPRRRTRPACRSSRSRRGARAARAGRTAWSASSLRDDVAVVDDVLRRRRWRFGVASGSSSWLGSFMPAPPAGATLVNAPVIAATSSSIVASARSKCAERRPKRSTSTRSATSRASGSVCVISTTPSPWSRTRRMRSSTRRVWTHAEGGGRLVEEDHPFGPQRRAGDRHRLALSARQRGHRHRGVLHRRHLEIVERCHRPPAHRPLVGEHATAADLPAEEHVGGGVEVRRQGEVLVHGLDAQAVGVERRVERHRLAVEEDLPVVGGMDPRQHLDERRLAGAVVADQRRHRAGVDDEVGALQGVDRAERLDEHRALRAREWRSRSPIVHLCLPSSSRRRTVRRARRR